MTRQGGEDDLDRLPSIAPSAEDVDSYRRTSRRAEGGGDAARASSRAGLLVPYLLIALLIAGLATCGWFLVLHQETLDANREVLADISARLERIEGRLSTTGAALSEAESETEEQINFWESEIRKLWDVSNKRNKGWIEENQEQLATHGEQLDTQASTLETLQATASRQAKLLEGLSGLDERTAEITSRQREVTDRLNSLGQTVNALSANLEDEVAANSEAVEAIDAWRPQVNNRLNRLAERLEGLSGQRSGSGDSEAPTISPEMGSSGAQ